MSTPPRRHDRRDVAPCPADPAGAQSGRSPAGEAGIPRRWPPPPRLACARHARTLSAAVAFSRTPYQYAAAISTAGTLASHSAHRCGRPSQPCGRGRHAEAAAHVAAAQQSPGGPAIETVQARDPSAVSTRFRQSKWCPAPYRKARALGAKAPGLAPGGGWAADQLSRVTPRRAPAIGSTRLSH